MCQRRMVVLNAALAGLLFAGSAQAASVFAMPGGQKSLDFVPVGNAGNTADTTGYGSVAYNYSIGKYDVTAGQYTQFLNAVAATDTYGLYNDLMASAPVGASGIVRSGSSGSYTYSVDSAHADFPVNFVSWGDAARFSNWLENGQPTGSQGLGTTETGSYDLNGATTSAALMAISRDVDATYVIPSENEWYKAAHYKAGGTNAGYWLFATRSNSAPSNVLSSTGTNNANYNDGDYTNAPAYLTSVGAFEASPSAYGTYDQNGDVRQWNEASVSGGTKRGNRGGSFGGNTFYLQSTNPFSYAPTYEGVDTGFRIAQVPEPAILAGFAAASCGLLIRKRRR